MGHLEDADGHGTYEDPSCGGKLDITLKIREDRILDAKFKTSGNDSTVATSSITTEMIIGMTVEETLALTNEDILKELGEDPDEGTACAILADKALKLAIYDYAQKNDKDYLGLRGFNPPK